MRFYPYGEVMNRHGSLVWWLVCIGLVLCWVWNFQSAMETEPQEMTALDLKSHASAPASEPQKVLPTPSAHLVAEALETAEVIKPQPPTAATPLVQASTFSNPIKEEENSPLIDFTQNQTTQNSLPIKNSTSPLRPTNFGHTEHRPLKSTQENSLIDTNRISNPFFDQDIAPGTATPQIDPVLTIENSPAARSSEFSQMTELGPVDSIPDSNHVTTNFPGFEDLEKERTSWKQTETHRVTPSDQFVIERDITPIMPAGQNLTSNASTIQQCVNHIEYGKSLARRGAAFAAREEFYSALRLIAQTNDVQSRSVAYTTALREAITALNEADDFYSELAHEGIDVDVAHVIEAHKSKIIPMDRAKGLSSIIAIQAYFEYARERMGAAFGENVFASEALYSLGKLFTVAAAHDLTGNPLDYSKSMVMHYAAMDCDSRNYRSANELGVLMARNGRLEKARDLFRESLLVERMPQTWRNLSVIHERLANASNDPQAISENRELARNANHEYEITRQSAPAGIPKVQWVTPEQFDQTAPPEFNEIRTAQAQLDPVPADNSQKPNVLGRLKDLF